MTDTKDELIAVPLEPCPFCGSKARECYNGDAPYPMYWVLCDDCNSCPGNRNTREEAADLWNRRDAPKPAPQGPGEGAVAWQTRVRGEGDDKWMVVHPDHETFFRKSDEYETRALFASPPSQGVSREAVARVIAGFIMAPGVAEQASVEPIFLKCADTILALFSPAASE